MEWFEARVETLQAALLVSVICPVSARTTPAPADPVPFRLFADGTHDLTLYADADEFDADKLGRLTAQLEKTHPDFGAHAEDAQLLLRLLEASRREAPVDEDAAAATPPVVLW
jgi:hypothetical protein